MRILLESIYNMYNLDLHKFHEKFPNEQACRDYLELRLWKNKPVCVHCQHKKSYRYNDGKLFKCQKCKKQYRVTTGTVFENSNLPLRKWFLAFYLISEHKAGISSVQLAKYLGITQKTAWYVAHKIRYVLLHNSFDAKLEDVVEMDETYVGGRKRGKRGRGSENKTPVFGMIQRNGKLIIMPVPNTKRATLEPIIKKYVKKGSKVMTDEWWAYRKLSEMYKHQTVNHGTKEYVRGDVHVNSMEGVWSLLKRAIKGAYIRPSRKHLDKYCAEVQHRYNNRNYSQQLAFAKAIKKSKIRITNSGIKK